MRYCWMKNEISMLFVAVLVTVVTVDLATTSRVGLRSPRSKVTLSPPVGGCSMMSLCCQGKNNTCVVSMAPKNGGFRVESNVHLKVKTKGGKVKLGAQNVVKDISTNPRDDVTSTAAPVTSSCFCDSACLELGDCCSDYKETCQPVDCLMATEWGPWGDCDARCGPGIKQRVRRVLRPAQNGGKPCTGNTVEKLACVGTTCKVARAPEGYEELRETAKIIPAEFGPWRRNKIYNPYEDIRRNLFEHYYNQTVFDRPSYCMKFELTEVRPSCSSNGNNSRMPSATAVDPNAGDSEPAQRAWTERLTVGSTVCVECQALAMRRKLGYRCRGHGVMMKETRWAAVATTSGVGGCNGKWILKSRQENCQCASDSRQSFILI